MCGRYAASRRPEDLVEEFEVDAVPDEVLPPRYNVAPTDPVYAVLERPPRGEPEAAPVRRLQPVRWGLVPSWAKDPSIGSRMINARVETVADKPAFRRAFARRRCLLPADGYYEWYGEERGRKQPFFITPPDGGVLAMAGLYELWRDDRKDDDDPDAWLWTATVLTTSAPDDLGRIHDRMPMLVERGRYADWLGAGTDQTELTRMLVPAAPGRLRAYPVSADVGNVRNDGPHLVEPVPLDGAPGPDPGGSRAGRGAPAERDGPRDQEALF
jgi:putative SOS response-associated peptidase YedK